MDNMSGQDLFNELQCKVALLDTALNQLGNRGRAHAQAEHDYKVALAKQMLIEREKSVPVTILPDICRGNREIAKLRLERDIAEVTYRAALEAINIYKLQVKVLENQIEREFHRA